MRFTVALATLAFTSVPCAAQERIAPPVTRFTATLTAIGAPQRNARLMLSFDVKADEPSPQAKVSFQLPPGVRVLGGSTSWAGSLARGDRRSFTVRVQLADTGIFRIGARVSDTTRLPIPALNRSENAVVYVVAGLTRGFIARDIDERFVPPGRRALNHVLAQSE